MSVAGPIVAALMADWGADVVWIENPKGPDIARGGTGSTIDVDRRNMREIAINIASPEGKEFFLKQLKETDIFVETSKPGQYDKWGLTDEAMWEANPKLIIVHISGFGQDCAPEYYGRASYDPVAQAYGGMMYYNSIPGMPSRPALFSIGDYYTAFYACSAALSAYIHVLKGGKGESIDVAQYEAVVRTQTCWAADTWNLGKLFDREGDYNANGGTAGFTSYACADGDEVYILVLGPGVVKATCEFLKLPYGSEDIPTGAPMLHESTAGGKLLDATLKQYFSEHDSETAEREMSKVGIPIARVLRFEQMPDHPLFKSRESIIEYPRVNGEPFKAPAIVPKFKNNPCKVWRGGPGIGQDNEDILAELGYSEQDVAALYASGVIRKV
jgi:L-carnitine CoA-transferase